MASGSDKKAADAERSLVAIADSEGNEYDYEILDVVELDSRQYAVLLPVESEEREVTILELLADDDAGEETLAGIDDADILERAFALFLERQDKDGME